jgi:two-component system OmpR family sensor kinase
VAFTNDGSRSNVRRAGYGDDPEPLPELPAVSSPSFKAMLGHVVTLPANGEDFDYRVLTFRTRTGYQVLATPLEDVEGAASDLLQTFVLTGLGVLLLGAAATWLVIRRSMRPVDRMIGTASAIAAGDLSRRVDHVDDGSELGDLAHALDEMLTQLEGAFDDREASRERLEQFVADASHELRTPLTAIRGYAELYRSGGIQPGEQLDRAMGRIEQESSRMSALVDALLALARLDQQQPLTRERVDLAALASDAVGDFRAIDPERPITLDIAGPVTVLGDEAQLRQVVANLVTNARVHTPPRTPVRVSVTSAPGGARLIVGDGGPGIADADQRRIFERFFRADPSRSRERGGSGLGLAIVAAVVAAHGGRIEVDGTPGAGTTFTVTLPRDEPV